MKRLFFALAVAIGAGVVGMGLDAACPVFFLSEPIVLWTAQGADPVHLVHSGEMWEVAWRSIPEGERMRWEADLPFDAPPGVWIASTGSVSYAFLRVPDAVGVVEVRTSPGAAIAVSGQARVADASGWAFFILEPGDHELAVEVGGEEVRRPLHIEADTRSAVTLALASLETSTPIVLPGSSLTLFVRIIAPRDLPALNAEVELPAGWSSAPDRGVFDPVVGGKLTIRSWRVSVPAAASPGDYALAVAFPDLGLEAQARVSVADRLPAEVVVCHWDVTGGKLDLAARCAITYERLRWAATLVGQELPFTGRVFTPAELEALAAEWEKGP
ncbi:MAG TPA: hypothetical protein ENN53_04640 [Candidatus Acetothermia bacterium]|nr:hypothetical protein [Candidatus Acetothermia bacterium]